MMMLRKTAVHKEGRCTVMRKCMKHDDDDRDESKCRCLWRTSEVTAE